ncbi:hypothetical protein IH785_01185 [candidate division KSB1 bacterium]|nr:hypothetical protein [candidate division KSB1 bacterium]
MPEDKLSMTRKDGGLSVRSDLSSSQATAMQIFRQQHLIEWPEQTTTGYQICDRAGG